MIIIILVDIVFLVDGSWGSWGDWTPCSTSCGVGEKIRSRECDDPAPENGGQSCQGNGTQVNTCAERPCPGKYGFMIVSVQ